MSLGTILLIILVIALLGGFSGLGGGPFYGTGYYGWRRARPHTRYRAGLGSAWQALNCPKPKRVATACAIVTGRSHR